MRLQCFRSQGRFPSSTPPSLWCRAYAILQATPAHVICSLTCPLVPSLCSPVWSPVPLLSCPSRSSQWTRSPPYPPTHQRRLISSKASEKLEQAAAMVVRELLHVF